MEKIKWVSCDEIKNIYSDGERNLDKLQNMINQVSNINDKCSDNMKKLNAMMLELKGLIAMVRPQVKKTGWYGDEIQTEEKQFSIEIEYKGR